MTSTFAKRTATLGVLSLLLVGCNDRNPSAPYNPQIPTQWTASVTNPYFPLVPGTVWQYSGQTSEGLETVTVEVLAETHVVNGVTAASVRDRVYLDGELVEDTNDWYAQDGDGNVWYLGEDSKEIENGHVVGTEGSWAWGVDGALPGIYMWADPAAHVGEEYRQEFYEGTAEDLGKVIGLNETVAVPFGNLTGCLKTQDRSALESGSTEYKFYCPGVGPVLEIAVGSGERSELISRAP